MRGIREAAMSQEEDEIIPTPYQYPKESSWNQWPLKQPSLYERDEFNPTAAEIARDEAEISGYYGEKKEGQIDITIGIKYTELTPEPEIYSEKDPYNKNWQSEIETQAIEIAYDRLKALFNKNFESKYQANYKTEDDYNILNVIITLIPINKLK